jgi:hypothetical protein
VAENEILYVAGAQRWRATRKALRAGAQPGTVAETLIQDLERGLRNSLVATFRKGATLLTLLRAASVDRTALRAVVTQFQDRQLARIFAAAIKEFGPDNPMAATRYAGALIADEIHERTLLYAGQCDAYQTEASRLALSEALSASIERYKPELMLILESSMHGQRVSGPKRPRTTRASTQVRVKSVVETSLLPPGAGQQNVVRRH